MVQFLNEKHIKENDVSYYKGEYVTKDDIEHIAVFEVYDSKQLNEIKLDDGTIIHEIYNNNYQVQLLKEDAKRGLVDIITEKEYENF